MKESTGKAAPHTVICASWKRKKLEKRIASLPKRVRRIHVDGRPYLWIVEKIVAVLPNLQVLRITRTAERLFGPKHRALLEEKNVCLELGYCRPELAWKKYEPRNKKKYEENACRLRNLSSDQQKLFQDILALRGVDDAHVASRYLCLNGESYLPSHEVGRRFGYSPSCASSVVSFKVASVIKLLYDDAKASPAVCRHVKFLRQKVKTARAIKKAEEDERILSEKKKAEDRRFSEKQKAEATRAQKQRKKDERRLLKSFGVQSLPNGIPPSEIATFCVLHSLFWEGELHGRLARCQQGLRTLKLRYGLKGGPFRTYESLGQEFGCTTGSVWRAEARAFRLLGLRICHS